MRPVRLGPLVLPPVTFGLLASFVVAFIAYGIAAQFVPSLASVFGRLPVSGDVLHGEVWRLVTYAFLHSLTDPFHLVFNSLAIYFFGRELEDRWGAGRYLLFFFVTVVVGGLFVVAAGAFGIGVGKAIGASAFAEGLCVAWGVTYRDRPVRLFFALPATGISLVWFALAMWVLDAVSLSSTSAAAHLGGMLAAAVMVFVVFRPNQRKFWWATLREKLGGKRQPKLHLVPKPDPKTDQKWVN